VQVTVRAAAAEVPRPRAPAGVERADLFGLRALAALASGELDPLVLFETAEAFRLNCGVMNENVSGAVVRGDEAITFVGVEPLYGSLRHVLSLLL
jgi:hypothetical protein